MRTRRVGSLTCGIVLILFGILFLIRRLLPFVTFKLIFGLWPLILVSLGIEILLCNFRKTEQTLKYDGAAIFLVIALAFFSMGMAAAEFAFYHTPLYLCW